jgi:hypothetical protein
MRMNKAPSLFNPPASREIQVPVGTFFISRETHSAFSGIFFVRNLAQNLMVELNAHHTNTSNKEKIYD